MYVTLKPFTQIECSFYQTQHTSFLKQKIHLVLTAGIQQYLHLVQNVYMCGGVELSCTNFGRHFLQSMFGTIL